MKILFRGSIFILLSGSIAFGVNVLISSYRTSPRHEIGVYDSKLTGEKVSWAGPRIGETIELSKLISFNNLSFKDVSNAKLVMLLVINPGCIVCQTTTDQMREIENFTAKNAIEFSVVSFRRDVSLSELQSFREHAGLSVQIFSFDGNETDISPSSTGLQYPTYILTNGNGKILRIFAGSQNDLGLRQKLTEQIKFDTLEESRQIY